MSRHRALSLAVLGCVTAAVATTALVVEQLEHQQNRTERRRLRREIQLLKETQLVEDNAVVKTDKRRRDVVDDDDGEAETRKTKLRKTDVHNNISVMDLERALGLLHKIYTEIPEATRLFENEVSREGLPVIKSHARPLRIGESDGDENSGSQTESSQDQERFFEINGKED